MIEILTEIRLRLISYSVQDGMVFISMTSDHLLARTAQYQIKYSSNRGARRRGESRFIGQPPIMSIHHHGDGTMSTEQARARRLFDIGQQDEECNYRTAQIPADFEVLNGPAFRVTTECSDDDSDETSSFLRRPPNRFGGPSFEESDDEDLLSPIRDEYPLEHELPSLGPAEIPAHATRPTRSVRLRLGARSDHPPAATVTDPPVETRTIDGPQSTGLEAGSATGEELMAPHARFFIERDKSKCTVRFDPPVSGRFILLKMWSPNQDAKGNIDIESVVAKGFAGPRLFPGVVLR